MANKKDLKEIEEIPSAMRDAIAAHEAGKPITLDNILTGTEWDGVKQELKEKGMAMFRDNDGKDRFLAVNVDAEGRVMDVAAAIPRNPGRAYDFVDQITDFQDTNATETDRQDAIALFHRIARIDGTTNNALNKLAALMAPEGSFKVRSVRGQRGKAGDKVSEELETLLNWWKDNVNARSDGGVINGDRGLSAFVVQGTRLLMTEGDHIARYPFSRVNVPRLGKAYNLPMVMQTFSAQHIEIPSGLESTNAEILYWTPPQEFISLLENNDDPNLKKYLDKLVPAKVRSALISDKRYFLDPDLLMHIKFRATQVDAFGVSLIEPTLPEIRYKRALDALELTVLTNIMARAVIIKVGSDNEKSAYHKSEVTSARLGMLQRLMRNVGPSATILWGGPDINVVEVSAHSALLDIVPRMQMAERRHLMALGLPAVLMIGEGSDGKAAGFAASLGVAAELAEVQNQYRQSFIQLAEKIGAQNKFAEIEVTWEWKDNLLEDRQAAAELLLKMFDRGLLSPETTLEEAGFDPAAETVRQQYAVRQGHKKEVYGPPKASLPNVGGAGGDSNGGGGDGRPTNEENPNKDPREGKETKKAEENK